MDNTARVTNGSVAIARGYATTVLQSHANEQISFRLDCKYDVPAYI